MAKRTTSAGRRTASNKPYAGSLGEMLDEAGFEPLGRRIKVHDRGLGTQLALPPKWFDPVVEFLWAALPDLAANHWDHLYIDALQSACQALVALGQAVLDGGGGIKVNPEPALPSILPRLDDVATVIVCLAAQVSLLEYRHFTGARDRPSPRGLRRPNIRADHGSGLHIWPQRRSGCSRASTLFLVLDGRSAPKQYSGVTTRRSGASISRQTAGSYGLGMRP